MYKRVGNNKATAPTFITNQAQNITVDPQDKSDEGTYEMVLVVYYTDYPSVKLEEDFTVVVDECPLEELTVTQGIQSFFYTVGDPTVTYPF